MFHRISTGLSTGGRYMFNWLRRTKVRPITDEDLFKSIAKLNRDLTDAVDRLQEQHERLRAEHMKLRGRVYALWGKAGAPEEAEAPTSLTDPRLTKAQVRAALVARGQLKPQSREN